MMNDDNSVSGGKQNDDVDLWDDESHLSHLDDNASYICDNCGEEIVIPVDLAGDQDQSFVEDCPVCCTPSVIHIHVDDDRVDVHAEPEQDRY